MRDTIPRAPDTFSALIEHATPDSIDRGRFPETTSCFYGVQRRARRPNAPLTFGEAVYGYDPHEP